jgi:Mg2+-importing ATPase
MTASSVQAQRRLSLATPHWDGASLLEAARTREEDVIRLCASTPDGLTESEAVHRLATYGPNQISTQRPMGWPLRLLRTLRNPLVILLAVLAAISLATGDVRSAGVISLMVVLGVALRFVQEARADDAAAALRAMIHVTATVIRDGKPREVPLHEVVPGDIVVLSAGDMIPADVRLLSARDLFVSQSSLTGESLPVEKSVLVADGSATGGPLECPNLAFLGTSVQSGTARAVVVRTGSGTLFGSMARDIAAQPVETAFDRGVTRVTWLMIRFIAVLVPLVFAINGFTKHDWREAFFFALAVAVGLTPEMLPMIVSVCLSKGAVAMSKKKAIVKRLNAIQNLGAMDVLCTDKTGTLTMDTVILEQYCDAQGRETERVLLDALLISHLQTGLKSALDQAVLQHLSRHPELHVEQYRKVDEIPFDFSRKIMSVVVEAPGGTRRLLTKGAPEEVLCRCTAFEVDGAPFPAEPAFLDDLREECDALGEQGFRVLAVAAKEVPPQAAYSKDDERDLVLVGYTAFLDPPKDSAGPSLAALRESGVRVKILTGDNELVTRTICKHVKLETQADEVLRGAEVMAMSDSALQEAVERVTIFARLSPSDKERVIRALQARGHVVGFLGDGINDALGLRAADVGISVDSAVDVAKESADIILLEKSLMVLRDGVLEGRKVFSNIVKYVRMGASSNFGNMFSVIGASALLPFLPMAPIQVLANNLLYDFSQVPIPIDNVDAEQIGRPRPWDMGEISRYIVMIGPLSSIFDYTTYAMMWFIFHATTIASAALFQTGWFVESLMTQTLIIHVIRTNKIPFLQSRPSWPLVATTVTIMAIGLWLPFSTLGAALGFVALPPLYWPLLVATLFCYVLLTQGVKILLVRRHWI